MNRYPKKTPENLDANANKSPISTDIKDANIEYTDSIVALHSDFTI